MPISFFLYHPKEMNTLPETPNPPITPIVISNQVPTSAEGITGLLLQNIIYLSINSANVEYASIANVIKKKNDRSIIVVNNNTKNIGIILQTA